MSNVLVVGEGDQKADAHIQQAAAVNTPLHLKGTGVLGLITRRPEAWASARCVQQQFRTLGLADTNVDVACSRRGHAFFGDSDRRAVTELTLGHFLEEVCGSSSAASQRGLDGGAASTEAPNHPKYPPRPPSARPSSAGNDDGVQLYLCQCPVISGEAGGEAESPSPDLGCLVTENLLHIPAFVGDKADFKALNLWIGAAPTSTNLHFDQSHNVLFVLSGCKKVRLLPPSATSKVAALPASGMNANHSNLDEEAVLALLRSSSGDRTGLGADDAADAAAEGEAAAEARQPSSVPCEVYVRAGEAVFIPEGWWHQVSSEAQTIAANVWFRGVADRFLCPSESPPPQPQDGPPIPTASANSHMREYYLRSLVSSLLRDEKAARTRRARHMCPSLNAAAALPVLLRGSAEERRQCLRGMDMGVMLATLPDVKMHHPQQWRELCRSLDPLTCECITSVWEGQDMSSEMASFYGCILGQEEEEEEEEKGSGSSGAPSSAIRDVLMRGKEAFAAEACADMLQRLLG